MIGSLSEFASNQIVYSIVAYTEKVTCATLMASDCDSGFLRPNAEGTRCSDLVCRSTADKAACCEPSGLSQAYE